MAAQGDAVDLEDLSTRLLGKLQLHHRVVRHTPEVRMLWSVYAAQFVGQLRT